MTPAELLAQFRLDTRDQVAPYLWSDDEVYLYLDEAQKEFCRRTGGLADATSSECARVNLVAGDSFGILSPKVLKVRAAFDSDGKRLDIVNFEDIEFGTLTGEELFADTAGTVLKVVLGMEPNRIKVIHTPEEDQTINLIVYRLPLDPIESSASELEIDEQHHMALLLWARSLAHRKSDAETFDRGKAESYAKQFLDYCMLAGDEKARREHKYRTVQFSW